MKKPEPCPNCGSEHIEEYISEPGEVIIPNVFIACHECGLCISCDNMSRNKAIEIVTKNWKKLGEIKQ